MAKAMKRTWMVWYIAAGLVACVILLQVRIDQQKEALKKEDQWRINVPRSDAVDIATLGYRVMAADFLWLQAIQYYATQSDNGRPLRDLYALAELITDLDPRFDYVYIFTGLVLTLDSRPLRDVTAIMEKGLTQFPDEHRLHFQLGYAQFTLSGDYQKAADHFHKAAEISGHSDFAFLGSRIAVEGGNPRHSIQIIQAMMSQVQYPYLRERLEYRIKLLTILVHKQELNKSVEAYHSRFGNAPESKEDLFKAGLLRADQIPEHPLDGTYYFSKSKHEFESTIEVDMGVFEENERPDDWQNPLRDKDKIQQALEGGKHE